MWGPSPPIGVGQVGDRRLCLVRLAWVKPTWLLVSRSNEWDLYWYLDTSRSIDEYQEVSIRPTWYLSKCTLCSL